MCGRVFGPPLARVALDRSDTEQAGRLWGAVQSEDEETGALVIDDSLAQLTDPLRSVNDATFAAALADGRAGSLDAAVALALGRSTTEPLPSA